MNNVEETANGFYCESEKKALSVVGTPI